MDIFFLIGKTDKKNVAMQQNLLASHPIDVKIVEKSRPHGVIVLYVS
jgi:hypothetical protein